MKDWGLARMAGVVLLGMSAATMGPHPALAQDDEAMLETAPGPSQLREEALQLIYASLIPVEATFAGVELLEQAAAMGDVASQIALGDLYLFGTLIPRDWDRARELYEAAAEAGNGEGLHNYGMMLMWEERGAALAEEYLLRAGEMGVSRAWATLAEGAMYGYLGGGRVSRAKFEGYAARGRDEGVERIAVLEAIRHMWGISVTASGPETLAILEEAADAGNREAALFLIRLVRDGNSYNIRRDRDRAEALLQTYRPLLGEFEAAQLAVTITAARSRLVDSFESLVQTLEARPELVTRDFVADLMAANENAAIHLVQTVLREAGHLTSRADGLAGPATVRALNAACREHLRPALCDDSALDSRVVSQLAAILWQPEEQS